MKHITFKKLYQCTKCKKIIVGYVKTCPICRGNVVKSSDERIVTITKRKV